MTQDVEERHPDRTEVSDCFRRRDFALVPSHLAEEGNVPAEVKACCVQNVLVLNQVAQCFCDLQDIVELLSSHLSEVAILHLLPQGSEETIDKVAHVLRLEIRVRVKVFDKDVLDLQLFLVYLVIKSIDD